MMIPGDSIMDRENENLRRIRKIQSEIARESWMLHAISDTWVREQLKEIREIQSETARQPRRLHRWRSGLLPLNGS